MVDEPATPVATPPVDPQVPVNTGITTKDIEGKTSDEIVKLYAQKAEESGKTQAELESLRNQKKSLDEYYNNTAPFVEVLVEDEGIRKQAIDAYYKKHPEAKPVESTPAPQTPQTPVNDDTRKTLVDQIVSGFEKDTGIATLEPDKKKEMHQRVGQELFELVDPGGTKTYQEIISSIPLNKLSKYFDKAYKLATINDKPVDNSMVGTGIFSSTPSAGGQPAEAVNLTPRDRELAQQMNVPEDKWLERKKQLADFYAKQGSR